MSLRELDSYIAAFECANARGGAEAISEQHGGTNQVQSPERRSETVSASSYGRTMATSCSSRVPTKYGDHFSPRVYAMLHGGSMSNFTPRQRASWLSRAMSEAEEFEFPYVARAREDHQLPQSRRQQQMHISSGFSQKERSRGVFPATHPMHKNGFSRKLSPQARNKLRRRQRRRMFSTYEDHGYGEYDCDVEDHYTWEDWSRKEHLFGRRPRSSRAHRGQVETVGNGVILWEDDYDENAPVEDGKEATAGDEYVKLSQHLCDAKFFDSRDRQWPV